jgi:hypothetical protein
MKNGDEIVLQNLRPLNLQLRKAVKTKAKILLGSLEDPKKYRELW